MDLLATHPQIHVSLVMPGMVATDFEKNALGGTPVAPGMTRLQSLKRLRKLPL